MCVRHASGIRAIFLALILVCPGFGEESLHSTYARADRPKEARVLSPSEVQIEADFVFRKGSQLYFAGEDSATSSDCSSSPVFHQRQLKKNYSYEDNTKYLFTKSNNISVYEIGKEPLPVPSENFNTSWDGLFDTPKTADVGPKYFLFQNGCDDPNSTDLQRDSRGCVANADKTGAFATTRKILDDNHVEYKCGSTMEDLIKFSKTIEQRRGGIQIYAHGYCGGFLMGKDEFGRWRVMNTAWKEGLDKWNEINHPIDFHVCKLGADLIVGDGDDQTVNINSFAVEVKKRTKKTVGLFDGYVSSREDGPAFDKCNYFYLEKFLGGMVVIEPSRVVGTPSRARQELTELKKIDSAMADFWEQEISQRKTIIRAAERIVLTRYDGNPRYETKLEGMNSKPVEWIIRATEDGEVKFLNGTRNYPAETIKRVDELAMILAEVAKKRKQPVQVKVIYPSQLLMDKSPTPLILSQVESNFRERMSWYKKKIEEQRNAAADKLSQQKSPQYTPVEFEKRPIDIEIKLSDLGRGAQSETNNSRRAIIEVNDVSVRPKQLHTVYHATPNWILWNESPEQVLKEPAEKFETIQVDLRKEEDRTFLRFVLP